MPPPQFSPSRIRDKLLKLIEMILVPDLFTQEAAADFVGAYEITRRLRALGFDNCTLTHGFFLNMEGFHVENPDGFDPLRPVEVHRAITRLGFRDEETPPLPRNTRPRWVSALK